MFHLGTGGLLQERSSQEEVDLEPEGSTRFPEVDQERWTETRRQPGSGDIKAWVTWERR